VGGKEVASDDSSFSVKDAGEWKDEMADRMKPPNAVNKVVEHQGKPLAPEVADKLRDWESRQEQIVQRIKVIRKKLDNLYLPTEDLDALANQLNANLDRLKENPSADVFRLQKQTLDRLIGTLMVFNRAAADFAPSLPRDQRLRGAILDEMSAPSLPGYEEAVKRYYEELIR
jgi:ABC-type transporter Mla subunit MlaD